MSKTHYRKVFKSDHLGIADLEDYIEAGSNYWTRKLYNNDRFVDGEEDKKALLPCTPLAIVKMLTEIGIYKMDQAKPLQDKVVTIFNRSEVIGRPLAVMMSNDGALVHSFDEFGPLTFREAKASESSISRADALAEADIVICASQLNKWRPPPCLLWNLVVSNVILLWTHVPAVQSLMCWKTSESSCFVFVRVHLLLVLFSFSNLIFDFSLLNSLQ